MNDPGPAPEPDESSERRALRVRTSGARARAGERARGRRRRIGERYVFASRIFRSLLSRQKEQSSISGLAASEGDQEGCMAHRAS